MTDRKAQYRQSKAKERQAKREAGLVKVEVWVPKDKAEYIKQRVAEICDPEGARKALVQKLVARCGVSEDLACGIVANMASESVGYQKVTTTP